MVKMKISIVFTAQPKYNSKYSVWLAICMDNYNVTNTIFDYETKGVTRSGVLFEMNELSVANLMASSMI